MPDRGASAFLTSVHPRVSGMRLCPIFLVLGSVFLVAAGPAWGQDSLEARPDRNAGASVVTPASRSTHATLEGWASRRRRQMLDQHHAYGDQFYDRGVFRHITPRTDREYAIDMVTYQFSPVQDYAWRRIDSGMRLRVGSIVRAKWAMLAEMKHDAALADDHSLRVDAVLQQGGRAQRAFLEFSYRWDLATRHAVGVRHTITQYKPDFDASIFYRYRAGRLGTARLEMTVLDPYNDLVFDVLGVHPKDDPYQKSYRTQPYLAQFSYASPHRYDLRGEVRVGWQPRGTLVAQSQTEPSRRYRDRTRAHYLGALLEYDFDVVTAGLIYQRDQTFLDRESLRPGITSDYWTRQRMHRGGGFLVGSWGQLRGEAWAFVGDYHDRQQGTDFSLSTINDPLDWTAPRRRYRVRLSYVPEPTGVYGAVEYLALKRDLDTAAANRLARQWTRNWYTLGPSNYRTTFMLGYRFGSGAVVLGINYDLDGDTTFKSRSPKRFDNGFFRFSLAW